MPKCKCGAEIVFAEIQKADGKPGKVPLDLASPCYEIPGFNTAMGEAPNVSAIRRRDVFVSHFRTCPHANDFGGKKK